MFFETEHHSSPWCGSAARHFCLTSSCCSGVPCNFSNLYQYAHASPKSGSIFKVLANHSLHFATFPSDQKNLLTARSTCGSCSHFLTASTCGGQRNWYFVNQRLKLTFGYRGHFKVRESCRLCQICLMPTATLNKNSTVFLITNRSLNFINLRLSPISLCVAASPPGISIRPTESRNLDTLAALSPAIPSRRS